MRKIEFTEKYLGLSLTPYQKLLIPIMFKANRNYICVPRHHNEQAIRLGIRLIRNILKEEVIENEVKD